MADRVNDGGPAFPESQKNYGGMTLRDYFAVHCDQPGQAEIATAAGLKPRSSVGFILDTPDGDMTFEVWWRSLSQERRFELYAKVRYAMADAMLKAREVQP